MGLSFFPGGISSYPSCPHTSCYSHCPSSGSTPSCHCGHHGPYICYQHSVHISTEPGHHCSSKTNNNKKLFCTLEGAVDAHTICLPQSLYRQSSTLRAPRERAVLVRKSSEGQSLSLQVEYRPTQRPQTPPQIAMGQMTVHYPEFISRFSHAVHLHTRKEFAPTDRGHVRPIATYLSGL